MRYYGILRERKTWVKAVLLLLTVCMLLLEIARKQWIYVPVMLLVVLARPDGLLSLFSGLYNRFLERLHIRSTQDGEEAEKVC